MIWYQEIDKVIRIFKLHSQGYRSKKGDVFAVIIIKEILKNPIHILISKSSDE